MATQLGDRDAWLHALVRFHEAGHAVACIVLDLPWTDIEIWYRTRAEKTDIGGTVYLADRGGNRKYTTDRHIVALAGMAAEVQWQQRGDGITPGRAWSNAQVNGGQADMALARRLGRSSELSFSEAKATAFQLTKSNWRMIERVAKALERRNRLTAAQATAVARGR